MSVYDYSYSRPAPDRLGEGVMRYLCSGPQRGKRLEADELARLHAAGKPVGLVWENDTTDPDGGYQAGARYGVLARAQANALGFPVDHPIYWAVDKRLNPNTRATALEYGRGFRDAAGRSRPYGESALIDAAVDAGIADCGWCPSTWDNTNSPHLALIQEVTGTDVPGTDANTVYRPDWGGWHPTIGDQPVTDAEIEKVAARAAALVWAYPGNNQVDPNNPHPNQSSIVSDAHFESHSAAVTVAALNAKIDALTNAVAKIQTTSTGPTTGDLNVSGTLHVQGT